MGAAVAKAIAYVTTAISKVTLAHVAIGVATYSAINYAVKKLIPTQDQDALEGMTLSRKEPAGHRRIVYGNVRVGGTLLYSTTSGDENKYLYQVYAIADTANLHSVTGNPTAAIDSLSAIYFNKEVAAQHIGSNSYLFASKWAKAGTANAQSDFLQFQFFDGSQTSASSLLLETSDWSSTHILKGIAYVACRFKFDADMFNQGLPNLSFVVQGRRVYNPSIGSHYADKPETWAYSQNSALCLLDYMRDPVYGLNESIGSFNSTSLTTAINVCNENIAIAGSSNTQARYTCNGVVLTSNSLQSNIEDLLSSMAGKVFYTSGQFHIKPKIPTDSSYYPSVEPTTVDEDMMCGAISVVTKASRRQQYNVVKGKFASADKNYVTATYPTREDANYQSDDGEKLVLDLDLPFTTTHQTAQRIAQITLETSRNQATINMQLKIEALKFRVGDLINVQYAKFGYNPKTFEIINMRIVPDVEKGIYVDVTAIEEDPNAYIWDTSDEIVYQSPLTLNNYDGSTVTAPAGITAEFIVVSDESLNTTPKLSIIINDDPAPYVTHYQLYIYRLPEAGATGHTEFLADSQEFTLTKDFGSRKEHTIDVVDRREGHYRITVQAVNINGVYSDITSADFEITADDREQILGVVENSVIIVQQNTPIVDEPDIEDITAAKGSPPDENDVIIQQEVDDDNNIVDSVVYNYISTMKILHTYRVFAVSSAGYLPNVSRVFIDIWASVQATEGGTWSAVDVTSTAGQPSYTTAFAGKGTISIYDSNADIDTLYNETVDGVEIYRGNDFLENIKPMSTVQYFTAAKQKALFRFEVDSQYVNQTTTNYSLSTPYKLRYTVGGDVFESTIVSPSLAIIKV